MKKPCFDHRNYFFSTIIVYDKTMTEKSKHDRFHLCKVVYGPLKGACIDFRYVFDSVIRINILPLPLIFRVFS